VHHLLGAEQLRLMDDAIVKLETKVGADASQVYSSLDFKTRSAHRCERRLMSTLDLTGSPPEWIKALGFEAVTAAGVPTAGLDSDGSWVQLTQTSYAIVAVSTGSNWIEINGDQTALFTGGVGFHVENSTGNDGDYVVISSSFTGGHTRIVVASVPNATANGDLYITDAPRGNSCGFIAGGVMYFPWEPELHIRIKTGGNIGTCIMLMGAQYVIGTVTRVAFSYDSAGSGHWEAKAVNGGSTTSVDTGIVVAINTVYEFHIVCKTASIDYYINGVLVATITTNLPTSTGQLIPEVLLQLKGAGVFLLLFGHYTARHK